MDILKNLAESRLYLLIFHVQDICISAVKEKDIEAKLKQVIADWSTQNLTYSNFKTRGELLLKAADTTEIVSLMEDSLMVLGSLLSNRCRLITSDLNPYYLPPCRRPRTGDIAMPPIRLSVRPSYLVFALHSKTH